jgi:hypothetical protein
LKLVWKIEIHKPWRVSIFALTAYCLLLTAGCAPKAWKSG